MMFIQFIGAIIGTYAIFMACAYYGKLKNGAYPLWCRAFAMVFGTDLDHKSGTFLANKGTGLPKSVLQKCSEGTVSSYAVAGGVIIIVSCLTMMIGIHAWGKIVNDPYSAIVVGSALGIISLCLDRQNFTSLVYKIAHGEEIILWKLWPRFILLLSLAIFDAQLSIIDFMDKKIETHLEAQNKAVSERAKKTIATEIANLEASKVPVREALSAAEKNCETYRITTEITEIEAQIVALEVLKRKEEVGDASTNGETTGKFGKGKAWEADTANLGERNRVLARKQVERDSAFNSTNCTTWKDVDKATKMKLAEIDSMIRDKHIFKGNEERRLTDKSQNNDFFRKHHTMMVIITKDASSFGWFVLLTIIIAGAYLMAAVSVKFMRHDEIAKVIKNQIDAATLVNLNEHAAAAIAHDFMMDIKKATAKDDTEKELSRIELERLRRERVDQEEISILRNDAIQFEITYIMGLERLRDMRSKYETNVELNGGGNPIDGGVEKIISRLSKLEQLRQYLAGIRNAWLDSERAIHPRISEFFLEDAWGKYCAQSLSQVV